MEQIIFMPKSDDWTKRDNCILMDLETLHFKLHNRTRGRLRLYLGNLTEEGFTATVDSIKQLDQQKQDDIRRELRFLVREVINPKKKKRKQLSEAEKYLKGLRKWQKRHDREKELMKEEIKYFD